MLSNFALFDLIQALCYIDYHLLVDTAFLLDFTMTDYTLSLIFFSLLTLFFPLYSLASSLLPYVSPLMISSPQGPVTPSQAILTWDSQISKFIEFRLNLWTWIRKRVIITFLFIFSLNFECKLQTQSINNSTYISVTNGNWVFYITWQILQIHSISFIPTTSLKLQ